MCVVYLQGCRLIVNMQRLVVKEVDKIQSFAGFELTPEIWHRRFPDLRIYHPRSGVWRYMIIGNHHVDCPHGENFIGAFLHWLHIGCIYVPSLRREFIIEPPFPDRLSKGHWPSNEYWEIQMLTPPFQKPIHSPTTLQDQPLCGTRTITIGSSFSTAGLLVRRCLSVTGRSLIPFRGGLVTMNNKWTTTRRRLAAGQDVWYWTNHQVDNGGCQGQ